MSSIELDSETRAILRRIHENDVTAQDCLAFCRRIREHCDKTGQVYIVDLDEIEEVLND